MKKEIIEPKEDIHGNDIIIGGLGHFRCLRSDRIFRKQRGKMMKKNTMSEEQFLKLKVVLLKKGITLREAMETLGVNYRYIYNLIRQENDATSFKKKVKEAYGVRL